ncbi:MAG: hypothetical protein Kow0098_19080 [Ignavibacteriaceae bacterium]
MRFTTKKIRIIFFLCGIISAALYLLFVLLNPPEGSTELYMFIYFEAFIVFGFGWFLLKRTEDENEKFSFSSPLLRFTELFAKKIRIKNNSVNNVVFPLIIIISGLLFRIILFNTDPTTSDDVYRYVWEGKVLLHGHNPFTTPPADSALINLQDDVFEKVTYKDIPAIYPPAVQFSFVAAYIFFGESLTGLRIIFLFCEFLTMIFLLKLFDYYKKDLRLIYLYAWLPLPIMEYFINVHLDPVAIVFTLMFIYFTEKKHIFLSAASLALAFLSKLLPVLLLPLIIKRYTVKQLLVFFTFFISVVFLFYFPFIMEEPDVFRALAGYLSKWEFNGSVFNLLKGFIDNGETVRMICAAALTISIIMVAAFYKNLINGAFAVFLLVIIFSTTLFPWYLGWISALNPFTGFYSAGSLLFTINFSNFSVLAPEWKEFSFVLIAEYIPFYTLLLYDLRRKFTEQNN